MTDRHRGEESLRHQTLHDPLTGMPNRTLFLDRVGQALARAQRADRPLTALVLVDVDRFELVNNSFGHRAGDRTLVAVAKRLRTVLGDESSIAHLGGDLFAACCENVRSERCRGRARGARGARGVRTVLGRGPRQVELTASVGIALSHGGSGTAESLLRDAHIALHRAKERGGA